MALFQVYTLRSIQVQFWNEIRTKSYTINITWTDSKPTTTDTILLLINHPKTGKIFLSFLNSAQTVYNFMLPVHPTFPVEMTDCHISAYGLWSGNGFQYTVLSGCTTDFLPIPNVQYSPHMRLHLLLARSFLYSPKSYSSFVEGKISGIDAKHTPPSWYDVTGLRKIKSRSEAFVIFLINKHANKLFIFIHSGNKESFTIPFQLQPAVDHELLVLLGVKTCSNSFMMESSSIVSFRSYMTQNEILELYNKANRFTCSKSMKTTEAKYFYRNKSKAYFHQAMCVNKGVMAKYIKNFGGDQASTLNRNIHGLFFSTQVHPVSYALPPFSFYGKQRLHIPVSLMMNETTNLYFADFYCHYLNHHVTLVLTIAGSESDLFCRERLLQLNPRFNPFLVKSPLADHCTVNAEVTVEVFYTEDVDISYMMDLCPGQVFFSFTECVGKPEIKTIIGVGKNVNCRVCNLETCMQPKQSNKML